MRHDVTKVSPTELFHSLDMQLNIFLIIGIPCDDKAFRCKNGQCLPQYAFCNAVQDCIDGSDENEEICEKCINIFAIVLLVDSIRLL